MSSSFLTPDERRWLTRLLAERAELHSHVGRRSFLSQTGLRHFKSSIDLALPSEIFAGQLLALIENQGPLPETGQPPLASVLRGLRKFLAGSEEETSFVDGLLRKQEPELYREPLLPPATSWDRSRHQEPSLADPELTLSSLAIDSRPLEVNPSEPPPPTNLLFLAANPRYANHAGVMQEARTIQERLDEGARDRFMLWHGLGLRYDDLPRLLLKYRPQLVHFAGHGVSTGEILVEDHAGLQFPVQPETLAALFSLLKGVLQCVVINACWSEIQAQAIVQVVPLVIGMAQEIEDRGADIFSGGFYRGLAFGQSIAEAFELGKIDLGAKLPEARGIPQLLSQPGVDAKTLRFI